MISIEPNPKHIVSQFLIVQYYTIEEQSLFFRSLQRIQKNKKKLLHINKPYNQIGNSMAVQNFRLIRKKSQKINFKPIPLQSLQTINYNLSKPKTNTSLPPSLPPYLFFPPFFLSSLLSTYVTRDYDRTKRTNERKR